MTSRTDSRAVAEAAHDHEAAAAVSDRAEPAAVADEPTSIELGPAGAPLGLGTAADFEAEARDEEEEAQAAAETEVPPEAAASSGAGTVAGATTAPAKSPRAARRRIRPPRLRSPRDTPTFVEQPLLQDETFRRFWLGRLAVQTGQGALLYALLIIVVDRTDASFFNSLFVACSIIPSLTFGLPAGLVVDALPRRPLLVGLNLVRCVFALSLVAREPSLAGIFAATLGLWTIQQFYSPTESATLAMIVPRRRYTSAQAMSNLALTLAQLFGLVILAPLLLKTADPRVLFGICALLFIVAAGYAARLPALDEHVRDPADARRVSSLRGALLGGWRAARADHAVYEALANDVLIGVGMSALIVIMPLYLRRVLGTGAENTVFVFAPAALGLVLGLRYAPRIGRVFDERRTATFGLIGFACCVGALGFVTQIYAFLTESLRLPLDQIASIVRIPELVIVAMMISIPAGFGSALVSVTARALLLDRTPPTLRGQVLSTQMLLGNVGALGPTLLAGIAADLVGVEPIAVAIACLIAGGAVIAHAAARPQPVPSTP